LQPDNVFAHDQIHCGYHSFETHDKWRQKQWVKKCSIKPKDKGITTIRLHMRPSQVQVWFQQNLHPRSLTGRKIHKLFFKLLRSEGQAKAGIETGSNKPYKKSLVVEWKQWAAHEQNVTPM
jgi:hypothetical protein